MVTRVESNCAPVSQALDVADTDKHAEIQRWWRQHRRSLARHLFALTGRAELTEDLVTETFIRAFQAFDSFEGRSSIKTWLHGIALNVARNELAKGRRREALQQSEPPPQLSSPSPEDEARRKQAVDRFYAALDQLKPSLREIFVMRVIEQRKLEEIAQLLGMPVSTVHARAQRAEAQVRAEVEARTAGESR